MLSIRPPFFLCGANLTFINLQDLRLQLIGVLHISPILAGAPASHLALLDVVETKALKIIGISHNEIESLGLLLLHCGQVGGFSVFYRLLISHPPSALSLLSPTPPPRFLLCAHGLPVTHFW